MNTTVNVPMNDIQVHTTKDYSLFKTLNGNRDVNQLHLTRLKESMKKNYLTTIIMVNEKFEIIDGQHRFLISQELKLPINYIISKNYGLNEVQILNANMKNWTIVDYVNGYCDLGYKDYEIYREFINEYGFTNQVALVLLSGEFINGTSEVSISTKFKEGKFKINDLNNSKKMADKIMMIEPYYKGFLRRSFIYALIGMFKNENFEFTEFLAKLKQQPTTLQDCTNVSQYKSLIEEIYNYRRREKINLRF
tara:strand:- start:49 stop:798 length:750 start_codon:yes stop_codon:yes gene_type:complete